MEGLMLVYSPLAEILQGDSGMIKAVMVIGVLGKVRKELARQDIRRRIE
jgi:hypothetical protein